MPVDVTRRRSLRAAVVLAALSSSLSSARADGLVQQLPEDGTWARFEVETQTFNSKTGEPYPSRTSTLTISSVGKEVVDGEQCRYIELKAFGMHKLTPTAEPYEGGPIWKLLIPEKKLTRDENSIGHVQQAFFKFVHPPIPDANVATQGESSGTKYRNFLLWELPYSLQSVRQLAAEPVECKAGKFTCEGVAGTAEGRYPTDNPRFPVYQIEYETRVHADVPYGVVSHRYDARGTVGDLKTHQSATYKLVEFGKNARSEIPEDIDPRRAFTQLTTAEQLLSDGKLDQAIVAFTRALRLAPTFAASYDGRGQAYARQGACEKAIADFREAIRRDPKFVFAPGHLAWLLATSPDEKFRDGKQAVSLGTQACELSGWKNAEFLQTLAAACAESGDFENAVKWQAKALEMASDADKPEFQKKLELFRARQPFRVELPK